MDIATTISAVGAALGVVKELKQIDAQFDQASLKLKIAELTAALADAKLGLVEVAEALRDKDAKISELAALLKYRADNLVDYNGFRYLAKDGKPSGLPYCPVCEHKGIYVRLAQDRSKAGMPYCCPSCKGNYGFQGVQAPTLG